MGKRLYVGNLPYSSSEGDLESKFAAYGTVETSNLIIDRNTGRSKGFAFVEMGTDSEAQAAIEGLNGTDYDGRPMTVNEAKPMRPRTDSGGGGGGGDRGGRW